MFGRDIDPIILENLEDKDLVSYCLVNKKAKELCQDQTFWYNRLRSRFPQIDLELMAKVKTGSWSDVYIEMVQFVRSVNRDILSGNKEEVISFISFKDKDLALKWASKNGHLDIVKYLVEIGASVHSQHDWALIEASHYGHLEVVKYLVKEGANIHSQHDRALINASGNGHLDIVKYLVKEGANIHGLNDHALILASENGHLDIVKYLVENGADIHAGNDEALRWASQKGHLEVFNYLKSLM